MKATEANSFVVFSHEHFSETYKEQATKRIRFYSTVSNNEPLGFCWPKKEAPWLYFLVANEGDGLRRKDDDGAAYYGFDPDLLPVSPLKINTNGSIASDEDSRYEIYVSDYFGENKKFRLTNFTIEQSNESEGNTIKDLIVPEKNSISLNFDGNTLKRLEQDKTNIAEFKMIPENGVETFAKRYELRVNTDDNSVTGNKKVLFSPTVIDDYYISWGKENNKPDIPIGFWSSYGNNITRDDTASNNEEARLTILNPNDRRAPSTLQPNGIYKDDRAINGYFMTLGKEREAEWHFALAGQHTIMVNIPTGHMSQIIHTSYTLHSGNKEIQLKARELKESLKSSAFKNWYMLYDPKKTGGSRYLFNLSGTEKLSVKNTNQHYVVVDGIKVQSAKAILADAKAAGEVSIKDIGDIAFKIQIDVYKKSCTLGLFCKYEKVKTYYVDRGGIGSSYKYEVDNLTEGEYKLIISLKDGETLEVDRIVEGARAMSFTPRAMAAATSQNNKEIYTTYKPQTLIFKVTENSKTINLPKVTLERNLFKPEVSIKLTDAVTSNPVAGADVTVKFGLDRNDDSVAYSETTDSSGLFKIAEMPYGQYNCVFNKNGYISTALNLEVSGDTNSQTELSISPVLEPGEARIRLSWGEVPNDLDSHLIKTTGGAQEYHIYYGSKTGTGGDNLDRDDTDSFGPETVTIKDVSFRSDYKYYVYKFSNDSAEIKDSGASVKISTGNTERTFYPPSEEGRYWKVFEINNGEINACTENCMSNSAP
ncbi:carboxypeptidase-like regulatory domain-containing protein [Maridesulfovibrio bastinii]|uniref:carboxypeptidase-like regulatory domain-containing protein n=1 Tax=Maridesulfovibrio bastinii TaxID=47157 RepID=UPI0004105D57|nr:carboxypeptidase-like regulatory domain-containing protein [Maridesulfovibrio bastinii]